MHAVTCKWCKGTGTLVIGGAVVRCELCNGKGEYVLPYLKT